MRFRQTQIFGLAAGILLLALLPPSACKRKSLGEEDGGGGGQGGKGGSAGGLASLDAGGGQGGVATGGRGGTAGTNIPPDAAADTGGDARIEVPPPPGFIPCGSNSCDPAREFCKHDVGGLTGEQRLCWPLPTGCAPDGTACACLLNDANWRFCFACRVVSGVDAMGLELDCPGAVG